MTTVLVYGDAADGYLTSFDASYPAARTGPADSVTTGDVAYYGQNSNGGGYAVFQTFLRFAHPAVPAGEMVTAATIRTTQAVQLSTSTVRDMELRAFTWSGGGLTTGDWRTSTLAAAAPLQARVLGVQASVGKHTYAGSETLRASVQSGTVQELLVISSRQRVGSTPTVDEGSALYTSDWAGTSRDPYLTYSTVPDHALAPTMGAEVQLSDGSWAYLTGTALSRKDAAGAVTAIGTIPLGTGAAQWADVRGGQGIALAVDADDHLYVVGRAGDAPNSLRAQAWVKAPGAWSWSAGTIRTAALGAHDAPINNVCATVHSTAGGTLVAFAAHTAGDGVSGGNNADVSHLLWGTTYLRTGAGSAAYATGLTIPGGLLPSGLPGGDFNGHANEVGTGLDVTADRDQPDWGYLVSFERGQRMGDPDLLPVGRYQVSPSGDGFTHTSHEDAVWGLKDAGGKLRALNVGSGQVVVVSADPAAGKGLTVTALQSNGTTAGWVVLGAVPLAAESIASMPDGPAVSVTHAWDAAYSVTEGAVWVYYVDVADPTRVMRTSVSLSTYQATRVEVEVMPDAGGDVRAIRTPRNAYVDSLSHVSVAYVSGGVESVTSVVDVLNLTPLAPTLNPRANYDASADALFAWTFRDPNAGDTQSAYQLEVQRVDTEVTVLDTGKTASVTPSRNVAGGTLTNDLDYRWRVRTWDALDLEGPWSDWGTFTTSAGGSVNITVPATDNPPDLVTDDLQVTWGVTGTVQAKYRIWVTRGDTGATVHDSGWVTSAAVTATVAGMVSDVEHTIRVQVENAGAVRSGIGVRLVTPSYGTPEAPLVTLTPAPEGGYVLISVENPIPGESGSGFPFWDFEGAPDLAVWFKSGTTLAASSVQAYRGVQSAALTATGTGAATVYTRAPAVDVAPGQRYAARAWLYSATVRDVSLVIDWLTAGGAYVSSTSTQLTLAAGTWTAVEASGNCPAAAARASYGWGIRSTPVAGVEVYADDLRIAPVSDRPDVIRNRILRRGAGTSDPWEVLGECDPDGSFRDYTAPSRVPLEYMARGEAA